MNTTDMYLNANPNQLLTDYGSGYTATDINYSMTMSRARPIFNYFIIDEMVMDPRVMFGLLLLKGPIVANTSFKVKCDDKEVSDFIIEQINRFWNRCINSVLDGIEWGFSSNEMLYEKDADGRLKIKGINSFKSRDIRVVVNKGVRAGILVDNVKQYGYKMDRIYLGGPKHFHYVHWRKHDKHYGRSRLWATLVPWWEMWAKSGYRDIRRLWFGKNAYNGGLVRYPKGKTNVPGRGEIENHVLAMELAAKMMTGAVAVAPSTRTGQMRDNEWDWMFEPVKPNSVPSGLLEYGGLLRVEVLESMGIPYEVVESSGNEGFGSSSGRSIPLLAYNAILFEIIQDIVIDMRTQILDTLIMINFGRRVSYDVIPSPLQTPEQEMDNPNIDPNEDDKQGFKNSASNKSEDDALENGEEEENEDQDLQKKNKDQKSDQREKQFASAV
jgi:hypothetical protein